MSLGGGYQQSESEQKSQSYGPLGSVSGTIRGTGQNVLADLLYGKGRTGEGGVSDLLLRRTQAPTGYTTPTLTATGLLPEQQNAFTEAVNQAMSRVSGNFANRGFLRPENIQAIAGSAAQNVAPGFANIIAQNVAQRTQAPLVQEDIMRNRFMDLLQSLGVNIQALGGESSSYGSSKSMGAQAQFDTRTKV